MLASAREAGVQDPMLSLAEAAECIGAESRCGECELSKRGGCGRGGMFSAFVWLFVSIYNGESVASTLGQQRVLAYPIVGWMHWGARSEKDLVLFDPFLSVARGEKCMSGLCCSEITRIRDFSTIVQSVVLAGASLPGS